MAEQQEQHEEKPIILTDQMRLEHIAVEIEFLEGITDHLRNLMDAPSVEEVCKASKAATGYMLEFYEEHDRWPGWWEAFEAGRSLGYEEGRVDQLVEDKGDEPVGTFTTT